MSRSNDIASRHTITASDVTSGTFPTARIADNAITLDQMAHLGTDGHILTSTGTGSAPAYEAPASADLSSVAPLASPNFTGDIEVDNVKVDGNTISATNTNGGVTITPNGTGTITATRLDATSVITQLAQSLGASSIIQRVDSTANAIYYEAFKIIDGVATSDMQVSDNYGLFQVKMLANYGQMIAEIYTTGSPSASSVGDIGIYRLRVENDNSSITAHMDTIKEATRFRATKTTTSADARSVRIIADATQTTGTFRGVVYVKVYGGGDDSSMDGISVTVL